MSCCGAPKYSQYSRMNNIKFQDELETINYQHIKSKKTILVEKQKYSLGEYFLKAETEKLPFRVKEYIEGIGFFNKNFGQALNLNLGVK